jgi:hypothetical protein
MKERMKENGWISVCESLPKTDSVVDIMVVGTSEEFTANFKNEKLCGADVFLFRKNYRVYDVVRWRYPIEKRPDFSKLMDGDFIIIEYPIRNDGNDGKYFVRFSSSNENVIFTKSSGNYLIEGIKKITRINIEKQIFEEI